MPNVVPVPKSTGIQDCPNKKEPSPISCTTGHPCTAVVIATLASAPIENRVTRQKNADHNRSARTGRERIKETVRLAIADMCVVECVSSYLLVVGGKRRNIAVSYDDIVTSLRINVVNKCLARFSWRSFTNKHNWALNSVVT